MAHDGVFFDSVGRNNPTVTIADTATTSSVIDLLDQTLCGLYIPSTFSGTAITFQVCNSLRGTYLTMKDSAGASVSLTVAASTYVKLTPADFAGVRFVKLVSGTSQSGACVIELATRPL